MPTTNSEGVVSIRSETILSDTSHTLSDTLTLQHAKKLKTIVIKTGDLIKIGSFRGTLKGEIISISENYISFKPKSKRKPIVDSIDVNKIRWLRKYNENKSLRATGVGVQIIMGSIALSISLAITAVGFDYDPDVIALLGTGLTLGSMGAIWFGYNLVGRRYSLRLNKWTVIQ